MLGYRMKDGQYEVIPDEAEVVKGIFDDYLSGKGVETIANDLNNSGVLTQAGYAWHKSAVTRILRNYAYTGNLLLQTKYRENHLSKKTLVNHGELPQYHATDTHEAIIDLDTYQKVQEEIQRRAGIFAKPNKGKVYPFTGLITCARCGKHYRRKVTATGAVWICSTYNSRGKKACASKAIPESTLLGMQREYASRGQIKGIIADDNNLLTITFMNNSIAEYRWQDRSRSESWTAEMRSAAGRKTKERNMQYAAS